jgi:hypothetical protein
MGAGHGSLERSGDGQGEVDEEGDGQGHTGGHHRTHPGQDSRDKSDDDQGK